MFYLTAESVHACANHRLPLEAELQYRAAWLLSEDPVSGHAGGGQSSDAGGQGHQRQCEYTDYGDLATETRSMTNDTNANVSTHKLGQ